VRTGGPVLLVTLDTLPAATEGELRRIQPATDITLGGTAVIFQETQGHRSGGVVGWPARQVSS